MLASPLMSRTSRFFRLTLNSPNCGNTPFGKILKFPPKYIEKQSAKVPGRPLFNKMMKEIETFGGNILAWNPDRLARNSVDGGKVIYLLDTGKLASIKFPTFWCDNTGQGKFMLNMAFGQSKYYVDSLSENTKRGLRQKVRMGYFQAKRQWDI